MTHNKFGIIQIDTVKMNQNKNSLQNNVYRCEPMQNNIFNIFENILFIWIKKKQKKKKTKLKTISITVHKEVNKTNSFFHFNISTTKKTSLPPWGRILH